MYISDRKIKELNVYREHSALLKGQIDCINSDTNGEGLGTRGLGYCINNYDLIRSKERILHAHSTHSGCCVPNRLKPYHMVSAPHFQAGQGSGCSTSVEFDI